ncbi:MAG: NAD(P)H-binding protein [Steroidobacteraceae bacterium]|nr:NAD(P)H-binding protein [Steroidobacteraceae bacterium]
MGGLTAILAGATGLVGGECLRRLLQADQYDRVIVLARRDPGEAARHPKVRPAIVEFEHLGGLRKSLRADHVFCALGTTIAKAGSKAKFREVDFEYPLRLAQITRMNDARHFSIVSALGASTSSPFFYSRVKGEVERGLRAMDWPSLAIFRPSVIAGERAESRPLERLSEQVLRFAPATWRPVAASDIAAAMVATALRAPPGCTVVESRDIRAAARGTGRIS